MRRPRCNPHDLLVSFRELLIRSDSQDTQRRGEERFGIGNMARIVQKFGGTSVADTDRIKAVAVKVKREVDAGHEVAVLLSAMSGVTNQLVGFVDEVSTLYDAREYDTVVSTGE